MAISLDRFQPPSEMKDPDPIAYCTHCNEPIMPEQRHVIQDGECFCDEECFCDYMKVEVVIGW